MEITKRVGFTLGNRPSKPQRGLCSPRNGRFLVSCLWRPRGAKTALNCPKQAVQGPKSCLQGTKKVDAPLRSMTRRPGTSGCGPTNTGKAVCLALTITYSSSRILSSNRFGTANTKTHVCVVADSIWDLVTTSPKYPVRANAVFFNLL